jgi:anthranilate synthase component 1
MARVERPRFAGGFVGYLAYELACAQQRGHPAGPRRGADGPIGRFMLSGDLVVIDHVAGTCALISTPILLDDTDPAAAYTGAMDRLTRMESRLAEVGEEGSLEPREKAPSERIPSGFSSMDQERFEAAVGTARECVRAGDCLQIVISRRIDLPFDGDPFHLYNALRSRDPGPYLYLIEDGDQAIVGSSPEMLLRVVNQRVTTVPIAGTRPRGRDHTEDLRLADELRSDSKERAEHLMLVDLARNDLGRVCRAGSVRVERFMDVERFSHVQHLVSTVTGILRPGADAFDALAAAFPAGTVSGAPKLRAMEIIESLEPTARGVYAGAVGYLDLTGTMDLAIAIRTAVIGDGVASVQVGAGIVADSDPAREWDETESKARGVLSAIGSLEGTA